MNMPKPISGKNMKTMVYVLSAELANSVLGVNSLTF